MTGGFRTRRALGAPFAATTYLRAVHLLLGGVFLIPYVLLVQAFSTVSVGMAAADTTLLVALVTLAAVLGIGVTLIPAIRSVEIVMARTLLGVDLPDPEPDRTRTWSVRLRSAAWYAISLLVGGLGSAVMLAVLSLSVPLLLPPYRDHSPAVIFELPVGPWHPLAGPAAGPLLAVVGLLAGAYVVAGLGALLARLAPTALGPGPEEALAIAERATRRLAAQARLAQEMHDTLGHALTASCRQAEAAARVLDTDPQFTRGALDAVAEVSRRALDDLDRVMDLLRRDEVPEPDAGDPAGDLGGLPDLLDTVRAGGYQVTSETDELDEGAVPAVVSRTAHRVVREALTNAMRHGDHGAIAVALRADPACAELVIDVSNPSRRPASATRRHGGRGLDGLVERCALLGGQVDAGPHDGRWTLRATLPLDAPRVAP